ncbi:MAG: AraC family ligand binding domain-containing protein [Candidatus Eremiobacteraeota bacterium]|nr:AraC family ligand binding domain-containing protein [Candidatus Eremiobacteraeota bacterium]MBV8671248.1 AraC family ligand binding domain-containing protein [Candidatus Eremiobacteraeota bacterium]
MPEHSQHFSLSQARTAPITPNDISSLLLRHGSMTLEYYALHGHDEQTPHRQDEIYVIATGHGWFRSGDERFSVKEGDALFVPAGVEHRFEDVSDKFETWVVFWGPDGGEGSARS